MANELLQPGIRSGYTVNGPAAGLMADQQYNNWLETQSRVNRDSDLAYMDKLNQFQQSQLDNPVKAATRELDTAKAQADLKTLPQRTEEILSKAVQGKTDAELKTADDRAQFMYQGSQAYPKDVFADPVSTARGQRIWDEQKQQAEKLGVKMPDTFNEDSLTEWQQKGQASGIYLKHRQAMELEKSKEESGKAIAQIGATSRVDAAKITADAAYGRQQSSLTEINRIVTELDAKIKRGEPITQDDIEKARVAYKMQRMSDQANVNEEIKQRSATYLADPKMATAKAKALGLGADALPIEIATKEYKDEVNRDADKWVASRFPGAKTSGTSTTTPSKSSDTTQQSSAPNEDAAKAAFGAYEPEKYDYVIATNPATGRKELARKKKK